MSNAGTNPLTRPASSPNLGTGPYEHIDPEEGPDGRLDALWQAVDRYAPDLGNVKSGRLEVMIRDALAAEYGRGYLAGGNDARYR